MRISAGAYAVIWSDGGLIIKYEIIWWGLYYSMDLVALLYDYLVGVISFFLLIRL